jgi:hypothetical protein
VTGQDLETLYKLNVNESHATALRGVFDAGYALGVAAAMNNMDPSLGASEATAAAATPALNYI